MSSAPAPQRIANTVKQIGELHLRLARDIEAASASSSESDLRAFVRELVRSVLTDLGLLHPGDEPDLYEPEPQPEPHPHEEPMSIRRPDFAFAHARFAMKQDEVIIEVSTGFERTALSTTKHPVQCVDEDDGFASARPEPLELPRNTRLVRLRLSPDHQIDPKEVMVLARPADRETAYRYDTKGFSVDDRTIDIAVRRIDPDINDTVTIARVDVLLFRIA